jgi:Ca2+-binding EF-hand superfamily protein
MQWTTIAILMSVFLGAGAMPAGADSVGEPTEDDAREAHAEVDRNGDGMISRREFYTRMVEIFYHNDLDKNGYLDLEELRKIKEEMVYDPADRNDDGKLTMSEYIDQRFEVFHDADANSDGLLSLQEVIQAYENS